MHYKELLGVPDETYRTALDARQSDMWTGLPGIIVSYDPTKQTAQVKPAIQVSARQEDGSSKIVSLPLIPDVPVEFPSGGGFTLTFPIAPGDECWLAFSARSIDQWYISGEVQAPTDLRSHNITDAVAFVGIRSVPRMLANVSTTAVQLRSDDSTLLVELDQVAGTAKVKAPTLITLDAPETILTGSLSVQNTGGATKTATFNGTIKATVDMIANNVSLKNHMHTGVTGGSGTSGTPTGGYS